MPHAQSANSVRAVIDTNVQMSGLLWHAFAAAWPDRQIVQASLAQLPWYHHIALLERLDDEKT